jgi:5-methylcytosine-specific restriction enzyme subunit McrC
LNEVLTFSEVDAGRELHVTGADMRALRRARHGLAVQQIDDERVRVGPRQGYAGTVLLPSGRRIVVEPKAPISDFVELLALAYGTMVPPTTAGTTTVAEANPTDWLLLQLAGEVDDLLARGLRRGYVERRELLPFVRGRVRPPINPARLPGVDCEYSDFVLDTVENRLLRGTLEFLAPAAINPYVRRRLRDALAWFEDVTLIRPSVVSFERVNTTRLNAHYAPSLRLARLALEGAGVEDAEGVVTAPAYFVPMWRVWEAATAAALRAAGAREVHEQPKFTDRIRHVRGDPHPVVTLQPDLLLGKRTRPTLVIDLKWANPLTRWHDRLRLRNDHLYQLATYCSALGCDGCLVYPQFEEPVDTTYEFEGNRLTVRTVDLDVPELGALRATAADLAEYTNGERAAA